MGGSPPVAGAVAAPMPRTQQAGGTGRNVPSARHTSTNGGAVLLAPDSLLPGKFTIKGAPAARHRCAAQTLDTDLSRQDLGTYQEDGAESMTDRHKQGKSNLLVHNLPMARNVHSDHYRVPDEAQTRRESVTVNRQKSPAREFELGDLATNRILFALALLGVLLPVNAILNHYHQLDFIYLAPHATGLKGPYHIHVISALYLMEGLLAIAVYLYGFDFIFRIKLFERVGTVVYAISLIIPAGYFYLWIFQKFLNLINGLSSPLYWLILFIICIPFLILGAVIGIVSARLRD
jgi:hypothetical protein